MTYRELSYRLAANFATYRLLLARMKVREPRVHAIDIREL